MCVACDPRMLPGLDLDRLSGEAVVPLRVHLPEGLGLAALADFFAGGDAPLAGRVARCPAPGPEGYGAARAERWLDLGDAAAVDAAVDRYRFYWSAMLDGELPDGTRYQLTLPTPFTACVAGHGSAAALAALPSVEEATARNLRRLFERLPADRLALQWDAGAEVEVWETRGRNLAAPRGLPERLLEGLAVLAAAVPPQAAVGYRLASARDPAAAAPVDCGQATRFVGAAIASTDRQPDFVSLPVPAEAAEAWYEPLSNFTLFPDMEIALGLVHDEVLATDRALGRLVVAHQWLPQAGVAPAPGFDAERALPVLRELAQATAAA